MRPLRVPCFAILFLSCAAGIAGASPDNFESAPVHPIERSPDGTKLFAVHTADARLVVFDLTSGTPIRTQEIPVGIEPVSVRARTNTELWVVNHQSDDVSIVDLVTGNVKATLLVGDEPTDVVFAGAPTRAYVCVSQLDRVRIYDPLNLDAIPIDIPLEGSDPRSLAVSSDGVHVYVTASESGNKTSVVHFQVVQQGGGLPPPNPPKDPGLPAAPDVGLIVKHDGTRWVDEIGRNWNAALPFTLLDKDVFEISTSTQTVTRAFTGVGTSLFNVAVNPSTGRLYVSNSEAQNHVRFEPNQRAKFVKNRVTTIDPVSSTITPRHLNDHIDYNNPDGSDGERSLSLSLPLDLAVNSTGSTVYVTAFGSSQVGVLDSDGVITRRIAVGNGPGGLALDEPRQQLYVWNRFESSITVVDLTDDSTSEIPLGFDPSSSAVLNGRPLLYDGAFSSAHGDLSCGSCHLFGGMDNIAWDLGDPTGDFIPMPPPLQGFHPMKGPMTTQSLKGLENTEPFHWRGDRSNLAAFNPAFVGLMGRATQLTSGEMQQFEDFVFTLRYPPNPNRNLDGSLPNPPTGPNPFRGEDLYMNGQLVGSANCVDCHQIPSGSSALIIPAQLLLEDQDMKVPQLRNMYEKTRFDNTQPTNVRGFGFTHDGALDDLVSFLQFPAFDFQNDNQRRDVEAFLFAFDTGTHAAVGAQWTMTGANEVQGMPRVNTLVSVANTNLIGLIAKGRDLADQARGWTYQGGGVWISDRASEPARSLADLLDLAASGHEVTFTAVVGGTETRLGIDRDADGYRDRDELDAGSDPGDPNSIPNPSDVATELPADLLRREARLELASANPVLTYALFRLALPETGPVGLRVYDAQGRLVRVLSADTALRAGVHELRWDLRDDVGRRVAGGVYFARLRARSGGETARIVVRG